MPVTTNSCLIVAVPTVRGTQGCKSLWYGERYCKQVGQIKKRCIIVNIVVFPLLTTLMLLTLDVRVAG